MVVLHERLQQSAEAEQVAPAARQAQRPLAQSIRPQHSLLLAQAPSQQSVSAAQRTPPGRHVGARQIDPKHVPEQQ